ncbi:MAG: DUF4491 family protein [Oscillospiraceae bacterium]|jgi:hypothetical protein|nr:DUF4491 family protein [Oscillospiraceae bacterium]
MHLMGLLLGLSTFVIIGALHPVVIKAEYYIGKQCWPAFLAAGLGCCAAALLVRVQWMSALLAVFGFSLLWSIGELFKQEKRVQKGWFPANPKRHNATSSPLIDADSAE